MMQMQTASTQSEIGIRLPFSMIDRYFNVLGSKQSRGMLLAVDLPDLTQLGDLSEKLDAGFKTLLSMDASFMMSIQNFDPRQLSHLKDILNLMSTLPVSIFAGFNHAEGINTEILSAIFLPDALDDMFEACELIKEKRTKNTLKLSVSKGDGLVLEDLFESATHLHRYNGTKFNLQLSGLLEVCRSVKISPADLVKRLPVDAVELISLGGASGDYPSVSSVMSHDIRVLYGHCLTRFGPQKTLVNFQDFLDARAQGQEPFAHLVQAFRSAKTLGPELGQAQLEKF